MLSYSAAGRGKYAGLEDRLAKTTIVTLDIASTAARLKPRWISHLIADSAAIPIADQAVDVVLSNHSVDMLRSEPEVFQTALSEMHRILKNDGSALLNFHHADLFTERSQLAESGAQNGPGFGYYSPCCPNPFYVCSEQIESELAGAKIGVLSVDLQTDGYDKWWSVEATKLG
jgi:ubiquinone/menaquinone biosynthesis C-methylase UbiE